MAWQDHLNTVQMLYVAYYQRPADPQGLRYWAQVIDDFGIDAAVKGFVDSEEAKSLYGGDIEAVIKAVYNSAFGRDPETEGLNYWKSVYEKGWADTGTIVWAIVNGAKGIDKIVLENKIESANNFTKVIDPELDGIGPFNARYDTADLETAREFLKYVDAITVKTQSQAESFIKEKIADEGDPIIETGVGGTQEYVRTLTPQIEVFNGSEGDDVIKAITTFNEESGTYVDTLNSGDTIDGKGGYDILEAVTNTWGNIVPILKNIEEVKWTTYTGQTLDMINSDPIQKLTITNSVSGATVSNLKSVPEITVENIIGNQNINFSFLDNAFETNTKVTISLSNSQFTTLDLDRLAGSTESFEEIALTSSNGTNSISQIGDGWNDAIDQVSKLTIDGDANLYIGMDSEGNLQGAGLDNLGNLRTIDASNATGNVYLRASIAQDMTITTSSGDDIVYLGGTLTTKDVIDLGEGTDTLFVTGSLNPATGTYDVKNVEILKVKTSTVTPTTTVKANAFTIDFEEIQVVLASDNRNITVNGLKSGATVELTDDTGNTIDTTGTVTLALLNSSATDDSINIKIVGRDAANDTDGDNIPEFQIGSLNMTGIETLNIESTKVEGANIENRINNATLIGVKTLNVTGDTDLTIVPTLNMDTIDASQMTGGLTITVAGTAAPNGTQVIKTGSGDDFITINPDNLSNKVQIDAGEGTDTIAFAGNANLAGVTNAQKISNVSNFEKVSMTTPGTTLTIDDATMNVFTNHTLNFVAQDVNGVTFDASGVINSSTVINVDTTEITTGNTFTFVASNGINTFTGGYGNDQVRIDNPAFLNGDDTFTGGEGTNSLILNNPDNAGESYTYTEDSLKGISGFSRIAIQEQSATNSNKVSLTISNEFAANNINPTTSTLTIDASSVTQDYLVLDASSVSSSYMLDITGTSKDDTIKAGAGDDVIDGGSGKDKIDISAGGKDVIKVAWGAAADVISGFTLSGINPLDIDKLDLTGIPSISITDADNDGVPDNYNEITETGTFVDNGVTVLTEKGYNDVDAAMAAIDTNGTFNAGDEGILVFYNTSSLKTEVYYVRDADNNGAWNPGDIAALFVQLSGVSLDDLAGFAANNFIV